MKLPASRSHVELLLLGGGLLGWLIAGIAALLGFISWPAAMLLTFAVLAPVLVYRTISSGDD